VPDLAMQLFGKKPEHILALLRAAWPAAEGAELARRTEVLALEGRTLRVRVPDARWRTVLHRMRHDILERLGRTAGHLAPRALGFHEGALTGPLVEPRSVPPAPGPPADAPTAPALVREAARVIADPELRLRFTEAAARYLDLQGRNPRRRRA
jgi:hypothetical protein